MKNNSRGLVQLKTQSIIKKYHKILLGSFMIFSLFTSMKAFSIEEVEELTYDDLVEQISRKKEKALKSQYDNTNHLRINAGFALLGAFTTASTNDSSYSSKYHNGFQFSVGTELGNDQWASEMALRSFSESRVGTESRSLQELDLKVLHKNHFNKNSGYRLGAGLGTRFLKIDDLKTHTNETNPTAIMFGGVDIFASHSMSVGVESGYRSPMVNSSADKGGLDFALRMDAYF